MNKHTSELHIIGRLRVAAPFSIKNVRPELKENHQLLQDAASEIEQLIATSMEMAEALQIIASGGEGQFQWSMTKAEALARKVISNDQ